MAHRPFESSCRQPRCTYVSLLALVLAAISACADHKGGPKPAGDSGAADSGHAHDAALADAAQLDSQVADASQPPHDAGGEPVDAAHHEDAATYDAGGDASSSDPAARCTATHGTVTSSLCCSSVSDFPNECNTGIGMCGCGPSSSHTIMRCTCPGAECFLPGVGCAASGG